MKYEDVKEGMFVKVTDKFLDYEDGWQNTWTLLMDKAVGKVFQVIHKSIIGVTFDRPLQTRLGYGESFWQQFPWQVLEPVDVVELINPGGVYSQYDVMAKHLGLKNWKAGSLYNKEGCLFSVENKHKHFLGLRDLKTGTEHVVALDSVEYIYKHEETKQEEPEMVVEQVEVVEVPKKPKALKRNTVQFFTKMKMSLNEIYSSNMWRVSFMSKKREMCFPWVFCKDYLHDAVAAQLTGQECNVYGFKYKPGEFPEINMSKLSLLVSHDKKPRDEQYRHLYQALKVVHLFEDQMKIKKKSTIKPMRMHIDKTHKDQHAWLIESSGLWMKAPQLISMYINILRTEIPEDKVFNSVEQFMEWGKQERKYSPGFKDLVFGWRNGNKRVFLKMLNQRSKIFKDTKALYKPKSKYVDTTFHSYSGIQSLLNGHSYQKDILDKHLCFN